MELIVATIFDEITAALARGERVELRGFGAFTVKRRDARTGRNPRTGEAVPVDEKSVPFFKAGKELRERVNRGKAGPGACEGLLIRALIAAPLLLLLVLFALSNAQPVRLGLWPTDCRSSGRCRWRCSSRWVRPSCCGALMLWVQLLAARRRARRAEYAQRLLEAQVQELKARLDAPSLPPPE